MKFLITMSQAIRKTFLYNFLISPSYRIWRHLIAILGISIIAVNQMYITFYLNINELGKSIYYIFLYSIVMLLITGYFNIYVLVPKYLLNNKYSKYISGLGFSVLLLLLSGIFMEYVIYTFKDLPHERTSYFNVVSILDLLSNFVMYCLCIAGVAMTILLRHWMIEDAHAAELEKVHIQSEVERLKEQVNPQFLSNILKRASSLTQTAPAKASDMLYKLSQLLRYQLYDCSRDKVLLASEIAYLKNYLALLRRYTDTFEYTVNYEGDINRVFVAPLLFTPFVHQVVELTNSKEINDSFLTILFIVENKTVYFKLESECINENNNIDFSDILKRLELLYSENYTLTISPGSIILELKQL